MFFSPSDQFRWRQGVGGSACAPFCLSVYYIYDRHPWPWKMARRNATGVNIFRARAPPSISFVGGGGAAAAGVVAAARQRVAHAGFLSKLWYAAPAGDQAPSSHSASHKAPLRRSSSTRALCAARLKSSSIIHRTDYCLLALAPHLYNLYH